MYVFVTGGRIAPDDGFWKIRQTELLKKILLDKLILQTFDDFGAFGLVLLRAEIAFVAQSLPVHLPRKSQKVQEQGQNPQE